ncbi:MAG TPA: hypothetical protein VFW94_22540 [Candidatus Acidoferrales bacterium]|nr:hypothetical protein [Candidatus Acidoferrales bacterium]
MHTARIAKAHGHGLTKRIDDVTHRFAVGPYLPVMHSMDAFTENFQWFIPEDYAAGAATKGIHHQFVIAAMEQHYTARACRDGSHLSQETIAGQSTILEMGTDYGNVGLVLSQKSEGFASIDSRSNDIDSISFRSKCALYQLTV